MKVRPGDSLCKAIKRGSLNVAEGRKVGSDSCYSSLHEAIHQSYTLDSVFGSFNAVQQVDPSTRLQPGPGLRYLRHRRRGQHVPGQRAHSATDNGLGWRGRCNKPVSCLSAYAFSVFSAHGLQSSFQDTIFPLDPMYRAIVID